jgi:Zn-dependent membrane protease YugP
MTAALWLLLLVPLVIGIVARRRLRRVYARYRRVPNRVEATGAQLARVMLDAHGLRRIGV